MVVLIMIIIFGDEFIIAFAHFTNTAKECFNNLKLDYFNNILMAMFL